MLTDLRAGLTTLLAPPRCSACRADLDDVAGSTCWQLCPTCDAGLERLGVACRGCARALGTGARDQTRCVACRTTARGGIRTTTALLRYRGPARALLHAMKYARRDDLARPLGQALAARLAEREPRVAADPALLVVPVPLHPWRRIGRGFNQARLLAEAVGAALDRPLAEPLRRRRATRPLYGVRREARAAVLEGAFVLRRGADVAGRPLLLVDDIRTSGATLRAAARTLRRAGARRIDAAVVGR